MFHFFIAALVIASAAGAEQIGPLGSEFLVNDYTETREWRPEVAANAAGFVVVWHSAPHHDYDSDGVFAQRFSSVGARLGSEFQVNSYTTGMQYYADVAMEANGDFVVVWQSFGQDDYSNGVFAQRFASDGGPVGLEFQVHTTYTQDEMEASVAMDSDGDFVVAWSAFLGDTSSDAVFAQLFDSSGTKVGPEFLVNLHTSSTQKRPRVAMSDGGFVVVWQSFGQDGQSDYSVFARRFGSNGAPVSGEFQVNVTTFSTQWRPDVDMGSNGDFVVVWESFQPGGDATEAMARRFDSNGAAQGGEILVNTQTVNFQRDPKVAKDANGGFAVTWSHFTGGISSDDVFARFFDSAGVAQGPDFRVSFQSNLFTTRQIYPAVAATAASKFVVSWSSSSAGANGDYDVYARRVIPYAALDLDRDGEMSPLTDGMLALRFLSNFEDSALIAGALGSECTRCTAAEIEAYAAGLGLVLDVNETDTLGPTDGVLLIGYLFGFTGAALEGNPEIGCMQCESDAIIEYLQPLTTRE